MKITKTSLFLTICLLLGVSAGLYADNNNEKETPETSDVSGIFSVPFRLVYIPFDDDLNKMLQDAGFKEFDDNMLFGGVNVLFGREKNRYGFFYLTGTTESVLNKKLANMTIWSFGLVYERSILLTNRIELSPGLVLGYGKMHLTLLHGLPDSFGDILKETFQPARTIQSQFFSFQPNANIRFRIGKSFGVGVSAGYMFAHNAPFEDNWQVNNNTGVYKKGPLYRFGSPVFGVELFWHSD